MLIGGNASVTPKYLGSNGGRCDAKRPSIVLYLTPKAFVMIFVWTRFVPPLQNKYVFAILFWLSLAILDLWLKATWYANTGQIFEVAYWLTIKSVIWLSWLAYTLIIFAVLDRRPSLSGFSPLSILFHTVLGTLLVVIHPLLLGMTMLGLGVPGSEGTGIALIYKDAWLSIVMRDVMVVAGVFATVFGLKTWQRLQAFELASPPQANFLDALVLSRRNGTTIIPVADVDWVRADGNYCDINMNGNVQVIRENIGVLEMRLDPAKFLRIHRSVLVNKNKIRKLEKSAGGWRVHLGTKVSLPVSRRRISEVRSAIAT
jgi:hypothetical protein